MQLLHVQSEHPFVYIFRMQIPEHTQTLSTHKTLHIRRVRFEQAYTPFPTNIPMRNAIRSLLQALAMASGPNKLQPPSDRNIHSAPHSSHHAHGCFFCCLPAPGQICTSWTSACSQHRSRRSRRRRTHVLFLYYIPAGPPLRNTRTTRSTQKYENEKICLEPTFRSTLRARAQSKVRSRGRHRFGPRWC